MPAPHEGINHPGDSRRTNPGSPHHLGPPSAWDQAAARDQAAAYGGALSSRKRLPSISSLRSYTVAEVQGPSEDLPFPDPRLISRAKFGNAAVWLPLAEYILNKDYESYTSAGGMNRAGTASEVCEMLVNMKNPDHDLHNKNVERYLKSKNVDEVNFSTQALDRLRIKYAAGIFGEPTELWWKRAVSLPIP